MVAAQDKELAQEWLHAEEWLQLKLKTKEFEAKGKFQDHLTLRTMSEGEMGNSAMIPSSSSLLVTV
ncbi:hypothetical protein JHK84_034536 [Glycine max]|nr:hypothetical protein JHK84_034536 [Glycine max]